jgi:hypothetical protein
MERDKMSEPNWGLSLLESIYPLFRLFELYEKEIIRACMIPDHLFGEHGSHSITEVQQEMTEKRIEKFLTELSTVI